MMYPLGEMPDEAAGEVSKSYGGIPHFKVLVFATLKDGSQISHLQRSPHVVLERLSRGFGGPVEPKGALRRPQRSD
jgi:hypothetical protein